MRKNKYQPTKALRKAMRKYEASKRRRFNRPRAQVWLILGWVGKCRFNEYVAAPTVEVAIIELREAMRRVVRIDQIIFVGELVNCNWSV